MRTKKTRWKIWGMVGSYKGVFYKGVGEEFGST